LVQADFWFVFEQTPDTHKPEDVGVFGRLGIEVVNLSTFPVTIREVGFMYQGSKFRDPAISPSSTGTKGSTPYRLDPQELVVFYVDAPAGRQVEYAYARTACGRIFRGYSRALMRPGST
jgi:hypothetical protein